MRFLILASILIFPVLALAECQVYGISDSPQSLNCSFQNKKIELRCLKDEYFINQKLVKAAYHYEVESGPTPLVFDTENENLVVTIHSRRSIEAELSVGGRRPLQGRCSF